MNNGRGKPYTLHGREQCLKHWAREYNIAYGTLRTRLESGIGLEQALTTPRQGDGYRSPGGYGIMAVWRRWITAPIITENNLT